MQLFSSICVHSNSCRCGAALENLKHFFLDCPIYIQARIILIGNINRVTTCYTLDIEFLTYCNDNLTVLYLNMFLIILNVRKDSLLYNWNWIGWTCTSYESILILFYFLFVNIYHWFVISNACLLLTSLL